MNSGDDQNKLTLLVQVKRGRAKQSGANQERQRGYGRVNKSLYVDHCHLKCDSYSVVFLSS